jgi:hypothetical protein
MLANMRYFVTLYPSKKNIKENIYITSSKLSLSYQARIHKVMNKLELVSLSTFGIE